MEEGRARIFYMSWKLRRLYEEWVRDGRPVRKEDEDAKGRSDAA